MADPQAFRSALELSFEKLQVRRLNVTGRVVVNDSMVAEAFAARSPCRKDAIKDSKSLDRFILPQCGLMSRSAARDADVIVSRT